MSVGSAVDKKPNLASTDTCGRPRSRSFKSHPYLERPPLGGHSLQKATFLKGNDQGLSFRLGSFNHRPIVTAAPISPRFVRPIRQQPTLEGHQSAERQTGEEEFEHSLVDRLDNRPPSRNP
jgi:hypothetical protein